MKSIHTFDVFAPTDEQEEAMNKKRGGHYRRGKNKEMDYFIECATSLFPNNHYSTNHESLSQPIMKIED